MSVVTTISQGKQYLRDNWEEGIECPCCGQLVKLYRRRIHWSMAVCLIRLYRLSMRGTRADAIDPGFWFHVNEFGADGTQGGDFAKLAYWDLIEAKPVVEGQKGRTSGVWKITPGGIEFVENRLTVKEVVKVFNGKVVGFDGGFVDIKKALGEKFDYSALMRGDDVKTLEEAINEAKGTNL